MTNFSSPAQPLNFLHETRPYRGNAILEIMQAYSRLERFCYLENQVFNVGNQINDLEQYGRRQNLEIQGVAMNDDQETP